jgi:hypothetical protein
MNLEKEFDKFFHEIENYCLRSERFYDDVMVIRNSKREPLTHYNEIMEAWLQAAFNAGAKAMAEDTLGTLRDFGNAVAGIDKTRNLTEGFDAAADNLVIYYNSIFKE